MTLLHILISVPFIVIAVLIASGVLKKQKGIRKYLQCLGGSLVYIGGLGFFGTAISSSIQIPKSFEWPIGLADQIIPLSNGYVLAMHHPSARVQVYDVEQVFVRGWSVAASGGGFKGKLLSDGRVEIWTARGQKKFVYTLDGSLIEQGSYSPKTFADIEIQVEKGKLPIFLPFWIFANPAIAWGVGFCGMLILLVCNKFLKKIVES
ncbi:MAG: hypothetical protein V4727_13605 [Verrucomicrobiota bacterium]